MTRVATLILNWNGFEDTCECVASVLCAESDGWEHTPVVVDNGSTDGSADRLEERFPGLTVVRLPQNHGFAGGMNRAIDWARERGFDHVVLLNNDTVVAPDALAQLVAHARRPGIGAVMPVIEEYGTGEVALAGARLLRPWQRVEPVETPLDVASYPVELVTGCCVLLPLAVLERTGAFDERFYLYHEDIDLALRIAAAGYGLWVVPGARIEHKESRSTGGVTSPGALYYLLRNNLLLNRRWAAGRAARVLGYLYLAALSGKIALNPLLARRPARAPATAVAVVQAWRDFVRGRWGARP
jgi:GT2 family glycosyltransferase